MFNTLDIQSNVLDGWMISLCFAPVLFSITLRLLFLPFLFRLCFEISQLSQAIWAAYHRVRLWVTTGRDEALGSSKKWYTIHVHPWIYIVVVACISFRQLDSKPQPTRLSADSYFSLVVIQLVMSPDCKTLERIGSIPTVCVLEHPEPP
jgi:hypothetical protein